MCVVVVGAAAVVALIATLLLTRKSTKLYAAARAETKQNPLGGKKNEIKTASSSLQLVAFFCENFISLSFCYAHRFFFLFTKKHGSKTDCVCTNKKENIISLLTNKKVLFSPRLSTKVKDRLVFFSSLMLRSPRTSDTR